MSPTPSRLRRIRSLLWLAVGAALLLGLAILLVGRPTPEPAPAPQAAFGGPFMLTDGNGRAFSSEKLAGKPYAIYFGFTRCGDVCPTTLQRLAKLRREAGREDALNIVFVTIDPKHDGPAQVGQYATLFGTPIIGLTGSEAAIDEVKKNYGIFAKPSAHPIAGKEMEHTAAVLLFDRKGRFAGTVAAQDPETDALAKIKQLMV